MLAMLRYWFEHRMTEYRMSHVKRAFRHLCAALGKAQGEAPGDWKLVFSRSAADTARVSVEEYIGGGQTRELQYPCALRRPLSPRRFRHVADQAAGIVWAARGGVYNPFPIGKPLI
jgi:hypothetical protein